MTDSGQCAHCEKPLPSRSGGGRRRQYCDATCRSAARRARTPPRAPRCSVRAGTARCATAAEGRWHDTKGAVIAWTCAAHRELAGELARAGLPSGRRPDRWLPASLTWHPAPAATTGPAYTLTIRLEDVHPPVWRQVQVPASATLASLHEIIQVAMGWSGMHLHQFGPMMWGELRGEYATSATLDSCLTTPGHTLGYLYDLGDMWVHRITLDKITARPRAQLPRCITGQRACPPEDCGGPWGYEDTLKGLRARKGWTYRRAREICGPGFNPELFDKTEINYQLAALAPARCQPSEISLQVCKGRRAGEQHGSRPAQHGHDAPAPPVLAGGGAGPPAGVRTGGGTGGALLGGHAFGECAFCQQCRRGTSRRARRRAGRRGEASLRAVPKPGGLSGPGGVRAAAAAGRPAGWRRAGPWW
jgi:hypothetical protein